MRRASHLLIMHKTHTYMRTADRALGLVSYVARFSVFRLFGKKRAKKHKLPGALSHTAPVREFCHASSSLLECCQYATKNTTRARPDPAWWWLVLGASFSAAAAGVITFFITDPGGSLGRVVHNYIWVDKIAFNCFAQTGRLETVTLDTKIQC